MTILQALQSFNVYPIPVDAVERICIERGLTSSDDYTIDISTSQAFELAGADVYMYLYGSFDLREQSVSLSKSDKDVFLNLANSVYAKYDDPKFNGGTAGFVGEDWNA